MHLPLIKHHTLHPFPIPFLDLAASTKKIVQKFSFCFFLPANTALQILKRK